MLAHPYLQEIAELVGCTPAQVLFKIAQSNGITPLTGTTNEQHMREDLAVEKLDFSSDEVKERIAAVEEALFSKYTVFKFCFDFVEYAYHYSP